MKEYKYVKFDEQGNAYVEFNGNVMSVTNPDWIENLIESQSSPIYKDSKYGLPKEVEETIDGD